MVKLFQKLAGCRGSAHAKRRFFLLAFSLRLPLAKKKRKAVAVTTSQRNTVIINLSFYRFSFGTKRRKRKAASQARLAKENADSKGCAPLTAPLFEKKWTKTFLGINYFPNIFYRGFGTVSPRLYALRGLSRSCQGRRWFLQRALCGRDLAPTFPSYRMPSGEVPLRRDL